MLKNIVGVFDQNNAQQVRAALLQNGFPENDIHVTASDSAYASGSDTTRDIRDEDRHEHEGGIIGFFKDLFGLDDSDSDSSRYAASYSDAVRRGNTVVAVTVDNDDEIEKVEDIMESYHAIDIDENAQGWQDNTTSRAAGWTDTTATTTTTTPGWTDNSTMTARDTQDSSDVVPGKTMGTLPDNQSTVSQRNIDTLNANDNMKADMMRDTNADYPSDTVRSSDQAYVAGTMPLDDTPLATDRERRASEEPLSRDSTMGATELDGTRVRDDRGMFEKAADKVKQTFDNAADRTKSAIDNATDRTTDTRFDRTTADQSTMYDRSSGLSASPTDQSATPFTRDDTLTGSTTSRQRSGVRVFPRVGDRSSYSGSQRSFDQGSSMGTMGTGDSSLTRGEDLSSETRLASDNDLDRDLTRDTDLTRDRALNRDQDKGNLP